MLKQSYFPTHCWFTTRLVSDSVTPRPIIKKSGAAPWQWISTCCPGWVCGDYRLLPQFWGENISLSTAITKYNWTRLWQRILRSILPRLAIRSVCEETEFVYLRAEDNQTVCDLRAHLKQSQSYEASKVLSIFPLASNLGELLGHRSYVFSLKERAESVSYIVKERCHPAEPPNGHLEPRDPSTRRLLAIEWLVARAVAIHLLSETQHGTNAEAASVYLQLVILYQCSRVFWPVRSALRDLGGSGTLIGLPCIIADDVYYV